MSTVAILIRLLGGAAIGVLFYGGLWFTVRRLPASRYRFWLLLGSFGIRTLLVLSAFLLLIEKRWDYALFCLIGFTMARFSVLRFLADRRTRSKCI